MKYLIAMLVLGAAVMAQDTTIASKPQGKGIVLFCTNGGNLHLDGEIRITLAVPTCAAPAQKPAEPSCKEMDPDKLAIGAYIPKSGPSTNLFAFCTTEQEDRQTKRDWEFCENNFAKPVPGNQQDGEFNKLLEKWQSEMRQCVKDRVAYRQLKESGK